MHTAEVDLILTMSRVAVLVALNAKQIHILLLVQVQRHDTLRNLFDRIGVWNLFSHQLPNQLFVLAKAFLETVQKVQEKFTDVGLLVVRNLVAEVVDNALKYFLRVDVFYIGQQQLCEQILQILHELFGHLELGLFCLAEVLAGHSLVDLTHVGVEDPFLEVWKEEQDLRQGVEVAGYADPD